MIYLYAIQLEKKKSIIVIIAVYKLYSYFF